MTTTRLYYPEAYRASFDAHVLACEPLEAPPATPAAYAVELDATAFYPSSGGQPFDTGTLGSARVLDVLDNEDGRILHVTDAPLAVGEVVSGAIDWSRRFDHMQQHTGQHVLSAAFEGLFANRTQSFHLGAEQCTIDLAREVTAADVRAATDEANRVVWEDRAVTVRFVSAEEAAVLPLRKEPARGGMLRLIEIADFDLSACGGTHVARTGGIGIIAVSGWEMFRGGSRVQFLCGARVARRFSVWRDALAATMKHLSVAAEELAPAIERLQGGNKALQRALRATQEKLAVHEAKALVARGVRIGQRIVVVESVADMDGAGLKAMASAAATEPGAAVVLVTATTSPLVVVARHPDAGIDASAVLKALVAQFGGRGGGQPDLAQGGGLNASSQAVVDAARNMLSQ
ncbi:MAG TPA: DHHA1 domain-containing protein [Vicinamibacterales bacterium]|nr:DHHA1 domain-containing protein [Vicinamibacterales bacterium]